MGAYTEIFVEGRISRAAEARPVLGAMFGGVLQEELPNYVLEHEFFTKPRWRQIGRSGSYYFPANAATTRIWYDDISKEYHFISHSSLKNYDGEIEAFFDWLSTTGADFFGFQRYEESRLIDEQYTSEVDDEIE